MVEAGGGPRLSEISCTYDPPIYNITSGFRVALLFSREAQRWTPGGGLSYERGGDARRLT